MLHVSSTPFLTFSRKEWSSLQKDIPLTLSKKEILNLRSTNNNISITDVIKIYIPLSKLLNLYINANVKKQNILTQFLGGSKTNIPYIIGITGSVASGKSTIAKILKMLLSKYPEHNIVKLVTTDGFLYSNKILKKLNLMKKKGFPQSYDIRNLINFILKIKSGANSTKTPVYSHIIYDIVPHVQQIIHKPDILILEGLNILQTYLNHHNNYPTHFFISDFIDFSIYIDAPKYLLQKWYINRFLEFCDTNFYYPNSYFYRYSQLSKKRITSIASQLWTKTNELNLKENILPTKKRANLILKKSTNHVINKIQLKK